MLKESILQEDLMLESLIVVIRLNITNIELANCSKSYFLSLLEMLRLVLCLKTTGRLPL